MYDVIIIGSGTAGIGAALYTGRAGLKTLMFGRIENSNAYKAHVLENYLGFEKPISGPALMAESLKQAMRFKIEHAARDVADVIMVRHDEALPSIGVAFKVVDDGNNEYFSKTVIIASGLGFKPSGIRNEKQYLGKGLSFCVTCDGPFFKEKEVLVIGDGNYAAIEAMHLTSFTNAITIVSHGKEFSISDEMRADCEKRNITLKKTPRIASFEGGDALTKIVFEDKSERECEGVFIALGKASAADFANQLGVERKGPQGAYIVANPMTAETNAPGVFAAGDCTGGNAQIAKSSGEGCNAGISVIKLIKGMAAYVDYS